MLKRDFVRFVALLLVPCLIGDPATASVRLLYPSVQTKIVISESAPRMSEEAFCARGLLYTFSSLLPHVHNTKSIVSQLFSHTAAGTTGMDAVSAPIPEKMKRTSWFQATRPLVGLLIAAALLGVLGAAFILVSVSPRSLPSFGLTITDQGPPLESPPVLEDRERVPPLPSIDHHRVELSGSLVLSEPLVGIKGIVGKELNPKDAPPEQNAGYQLLILDENAAEIQNGFSVALKIGDEDLPLAGAYQNGRWVLSTPIGLLPPSIEATTVRADHPLIVSVVIPASALGNSHKALTTLSVGIKSTAGNTRSIGPAVVVRGYRSSGVSEDSLHSAGLVLSVPAALGFVLAFIPYGPPGKKRTVILDEEVLKRLNLPPVTEREIPADVHRLHDLFTSLGIPKKYHRDMLVSVDPLRPRLMVHEEANPDIRDVDVIRIFGFQPFSGPGCPLNWAQLKGERELWGKDPSILDQIKFIGFGGQEPRTLEALDTLLREATETHPELYRDHLLTRLPDSGRITVVRPAQSTLLNRLRGRPVAAMLLDREGGRDFEKWRILYQEASETFLRTVYDPGQQAATIWARQTMGDAAKEMDKAKALTAPHDEQSLFVGMVDLLIRLAKEGKLPESIEDLLLMDEVIEHRREFVQMHADQGVVAVDYDWVTFKPAVEVIESAVQAAVDVVTERVVEPEDIATQISVTHSLMMMDMWLKMKNHVEAIARGIGDHNGDQVWHLHEVVAQYISVDEKQIRVDIDSSGEDRHGARNLRPGGAAAVLRAGGRENSGGKAPAGTLTPPLFGILPKVLDQLAIEDPAGWWIVSKIKEAGDLAASLRSIAETLNALVKQSRIVSRMVGKRRQYRSMVTAETMAEPGTAVGDPTSINVDIPRWPKEDQLAWKNLQGKEFPGAWAERFLLILKANGMSYNSIARQETKGLSQQVRKLRFKNRQVWLEKRSDELLASWSKRLKGVPPFMLRTGYDPVTHQSAVFEEVRDMGRGPRLKRLRQWRGISRADLERAVGLKPDGLRAIENRGGQTFDDPAVWDRLAQALHVDIFLLVAGEERGSALAGRQTWGEKILLLLDTQGMTRKQLADAAGISRHRLDLIIANLDFPENSDVGGRLAEALGLKENEWPDAVVQVDKRGINMHLKDAAGKFRRSESVTLLALFTTFSAEQDIYEAALQGELILSQFMETHLRLHPDTSGISIRRAFNDLLLANGYLEVSGKGKNGARAHRLTEAGIGAVRNPNKSAVLEKEKEVMNELKKSAGLSPHTSLNVISELPAARIRRLQRMADAKGYVLDINPIGGRVKLSPKSPDTTSSDESAAGPAALQQKESKDATSGVAQAEKSDSIYLLRQAALQVERKIRDAMKRNAPQKGGTGIHHAILGDGIVMSVERGDGGVPVIRVQFDLRRDPVNLMLDYAAPLITLIDKYYPVHASRRMGRPRKALTSEAA